MQKLLSSVGESRGEVEASDGGLKFAMNDPVNIVYYESVQT